MPVLKDCLRCRLFQGVSYVHPDSITHVKYGKPVGWYVLCGRYSDSEYDNIGIVDAVHVNGLPWLSYQVLQQFLRLNADRQVQCTRKKDNSPKRAMEQLTLFEEAIL